MSDSAQTSPTDTCSTSYSWTRISSSMLHDWFYKDHLLTCTGEVMLLPPWSKRNDAASLAIFGWK